MIARRILRPFPGSLFALILLGFSQALLGQAVNGTLLGTVTDPSGAVVGNATVTVVLVGQSLEHTSITNESGNFTEPDLPPGIYTVTVVAKGFKKENNFAGGRFGTLNRMLMPRCMKGFVKSIT